VAEIKALVVDQDKTQHQHIKNRQERIPELIPSGNEARI
jgi:hypothetical protein